MKPLLILCLFLGTCFAATADIYLRYGIVYTGVKSNDIAITALPTQIELAFSAKAAAMRVRGGYISKVMGHYVWQTGSSDTAYHILHYSKVIYIHTVAKMPKAGLQVEKTGRKMNILGYETYECKVSYLGKVGTTVEKTLWVAPTRRTGNFSEKLPDDPYGHFAAFTCLDEGFPLRIEYPVGMRVNEKEISVTAIATLEKDTNALKSTEIIRLPQSYERKQYYPGDDIQIKIGK